MACDNVTQQIQTESGRIGHEIFVRVFARSPWIRLVQRGGFPKEMGQTISVLTYERTAPTATTSGWSSMVFDESNPVEGGICLPPVTRVPIGSTLRSYSLYRKALEGPDFCAEQLRTPFEIANQLDLLVDKLAEYAMLEWELRDREEYFAMCKRKVVVDGCPPTESNTMAATYPASCPTSILTQGILDRYRAKLLRDGAGMSAMGMDNGSAVLALFCSYETSRLILTSNDNVRQDIRWGDPGKLLAPLGVNMSYRGFYHIHDPYPRRFTCAGGAYTTVATFTNSAATKGVKSEINSSWETAPYEESFIFDREVMRQLLPPPIVRPGANLSFDPVNYMGHWEFKNIPDRVCNPDGNIGFHRGILAAATMPIHPERGVAFVHLRCDPSCDLVTACS